MNLNKTVNTWLCYYGLDAAPEDYAPFDLVVFDSTFHPELARREDGGPVLLGYLSVAEVLEGGPFWSRVKDRDILVRKKDLWNSWVLDVRDPGWQDLLVEEAVPGVLDQGFDGVFLDTLDSALGLELWGGEPRFHGTAQALVQLIRALRRAFPNTVVAVNRGLPVLAETAQWVDALVVEGLSFVHDGPGAGYVPVDPDHQSRLLSQLETGLEHRPDLPVLTLDYAPEDRPDLVGEAVAFARKKGFVPYVSTFKLDRIHRHTLGLDGPSSGALSQTRASGG